MSVPSTPTRLAGPSHAHPANSSPSVYATPPGFAAPFHQPPQPAHPGPRHQQQHGGGTNGLQSDRDDPTMIYVGNLGSDFLTAVKDEGVKNIFSQYGTIISIFSKVRDPPHHDTAWALIKFSSTEEARRAIQAGEHGMLISGRPVHIRPRRAPTYKQNYRQQHQSAGRMHYNNQSPYENRSRRHDFQNRNGFGGPRFHRPPPACKDLTVNNLPPTLTPKELYTIIMDRAPGIKIEGTFIYAVPDARGLRFGEVNFLHEMDAEKSLNMCNGLVVGGYQLEVSYKTSTSAYGSSPVRPIQNVVLPPRGPEQHQHQHQHQPEFANDNISQPGHPQPMYPMQMPEHTSPAPPATGHGSTSTSSPRPVQITFLPHGSTPSPQNSTIIGVNGSQHPSHTIPSVSPQIMSQNGQQQQQQMFEQQHPYFVQCPVAMSMPVPMAMLPPHAQQMLYPGSTPMQHGQDQQQQYQQQVQQAQRFGHARQYSSGGESSVFSPVWSPDQGSFMWTQMPQYAVEGQAGEPQITTPRTSVGSEGANPAQAFHHQIEEVVAGAKKAEPKEEPKALKAGDNNEFVPKSAQSTQDKVNTNLVAPVDPCNLFVKNLDDDVIASKMDLDQLFGSFGTISSSYLAMYPSNGSNVGLSRGFGFVSFLNPADAARARGEMDGKMIGRKRIFVSWAEKKEDRVKRLANVFAAPTKEPQNVLALAVDSFPIYEEQADEPNEASVSPVSSVVEEVKETPGPENPAGTDSPPSGENLSAPAAAVLQQFRGTTLHQIDEVEEEESIKNSPRARGGPAAAHPTELIQAITSFDIYRDNTPQPRLPPNVIIAPKDAPSVPSTAPASYASNGHSHSTDTDTPFTEQSSTADVTASVESQESTKSAPAAVMRPLAANPTVKPKRRTIFGWTRSKEYTKASRGQDSNSESEGEKSKVTEEIKDTIDGKGHSKKSMSEDVGRASTESVGWEVAPGGKKKQRRKWGSVGSLSGWTSGGSASEKE
ncbi:hypothetical protein YB2330_000979 [Saitoella coloradoensis]